MIWEAGRSKGDRPAHLQKSRAFKIFFTKSFGLSKNRRIFAVPNEETRGVAQLASASGLGPEGPVFESQYPDIQQKPAENQQVFSFYAGWA